MKKLLPIILLILFLPTLAFAISGKVVRVADGDTITILTANNEQIRVRLYGIDCPERKQAFGQVARRYVADKIAGRIVDVTEYGKDRYGRTIGVVGNVNRDLLAAGLAWVYPQYCKASFCREWKEIVTRARNERKGLWIENAVPPWEWRRAKKK